MRKKKLTDILLITGFIIGLCVLLYPPFSNYVNTQRQAKAIAVYEEAVSRMKPIDFEREWHKAEMYNQELLQQRDSFYQTESQIEEYKKILNVGGTGIMGHIEINALGVDLPIYHTVEDSVLQAGVGHIPGSSLPTGGEGTHAVFSGHRGLPTSKLFTDLDQLVEGNIFVLHIMNRSMAYQVDQIRVVEPHEVNDIRIEPGHDYVTLVTCTPYGVNTHRILVRGHRIAYMDGAYVGADAVAMDRIVVAGVIATPLVIVLFAAAWRHNRRRNNAGKRTAVKKIAVKQEVRS